MLIRLYLQEEKVRHFQLIRPTVELVTSVRSKRVRMATMVVNLGFGWLHELLALPGRIYEMFNL